MSLWNWFEYSNWGARRNGKKDGAMGIPNKDDDDHAPHEKAQAKIANEQIRRVAGKWEKADSKLKGDYCDSMREYEDACLSCKKEVNEHNGATAHYKGALQKKHDSSSYPHMNPLAYKLLIGFIAVGEMPLTATVFDILGENRILTYLFAAVLCVALPAIAHFMGVIGKGKIDRKNAIVFAINFLVFFGVLIAVAYMREKFFEASDVQKIMGIRMDPTMVTVVFIAIQLFIFAVAATASYFAHDPHPELRKALKEYADAKKTLEIERGEAVKAENRVNQAATVLAKITALREKTFKAYNDEIKEIKEIQERTIELYRTYNLRSRSDNPVRSFKTYPVIEIPTSLQVLDVDCGILEDLAKRTFGEEN